jgi:hypothetical protein
MTPDQFNLLPEDQQLEFISMNDCLASRDQYPFSISLFKVGNFFAEIYYHQTLDQITEVKAFNDKSLLDTYVEHICLPFN